MYSALKLMKQELTLKVTSQRDVPASTSGRKSSPGFAVGSDSSAETGCRPASPQPRAAKRTMASWLPTTFEFGCKILLELMI